MGNHKRQTTAQSEPRAQGKGGWYLFFLAALWLPLFWALIPSWQGGTYYSYGWLVPVAMAFFYVRRRQELPGRPADCVSLKKWHVIAFAAGIAIILVLRILQGGNVHWRLPLWSHSLVVVFVTMLAFSLVEGKRAVRHYLPILFFVVVAIPLPSVLEQGLVERLTEAVSATGADLARLRGMPVERSEAAFIIKGQPLDVNDGCSGIRSFQSSLAAGLFVGELLRLALPARLTLLLGAISAAFIGNTARVVALIGAFVKDGFDGVDKIHDTAGFLALAFTYGTAIAMGFILERKASSTHANLV